MAMTIEDRQYAEAWLKKARRARDASSNGRIPPEMLTSAARTLKRSTRTLNRWVEQGLPKVPGPQGRVTTEDEMDAYVLAGGECVRANRLLVKAGHEPVPIRQFQRMVKRELTARQQVLIREGSAAASRYTLYLERRELARGLCLEADHKQANVLVQKPRGRGEDNLIRPWITVYIETFSRAIAGICISLRPTQAEVLSALGAAMSRNPELSPAYGVPDILRVDNGTEFTADSVIETAGSVDTVVVHTPPYTPNKKGKIEKWNRTSKNELFADMPFFTSGPTRKDGSLQLGKAVEAYPFELFVAEVLEFVRFYNYERPHEGEGMNGMTPAEKWDSNHRIVRTISDEDLRRFTQKRLDNDRVVTSLGIRAFKRYYTSIELFDLVDGQGRIREGEKVEVRYRPHDERSLDVYHQGKFLTTVYPQDTIRSKSARKRFQKRKAEKARKLGQLTARARRRAHVRTAGVVAQGEPEDISVIDKSEVDDVVNADERRLIDGLGLGDQRGRKLTRMPDGRRPR